MRMDVTTARRGPSTPGGLPVGEEVLVGVEAVKVVETVMCEDSGGVSVVRELAEVGRRYSVEVVPLMLVVAVL